MDDQRAGAVLRAVRVRRGWRQADVASKARISRASVSRAERGHLEQLSLATLRRIGGVLDVRLELLPRWRGGELDRLLDAGHSALGERIARRFERVSGWVVRAEVSFAVYAERGVIDFLAWHAATRTLLVIEVKTMIADIQESLGTLDRKRRLAKRIAKEFGWHAQTLAVWLAVADTMTNRRRVEAHRSTLRSVLPADGVALRRWLTGPSGPIAALSFLSDVHPGSVSGRSSTPRRVRAPCASVHRGAQIGEQRETLDNVPGANI